MSYNYFTTNNSSNTADTNALITTTNALITTTNSLVTTSNTLLTTANTDAEKTIAPLETLITSQKSIILSRRFDMAVYDPYYERMTVTQTSGVCDYAYATGNLYLRITAGSVGSVVYNSKPKVPYIPHQVSEVCFDANLNTSTLDITITRRIGVFDANSGFFFEYSGGVYYCVIRSNATDSKVARSSWTLPSADINLIYNQLFRIRYVWGHSLVEYSIYFQGAYRVVYSRTYDNALTATPMTLTCTLPFCASVTSTGIASDTNFMYLNSYSASTYGDMPIMRANVVANQLSGTAVTTSQTALCAIRLRSGYPNGKCRVKKITCCNLSSSTNFMQVTAELMWLDTPAGYFYTITGGTWATASPVSIVEVNTTFTGWTTSYTSPVGRDILDYGGRSVIDVQPGCNNLHYSSEGPDCIMILGQCDTGTRTVSITVEFDEYY